MTQTELALACGWERGQSRIGNYEKGKREPGIAELAAIAQALEIDLHSLIFGTTTTRVASPLRETVSIPISHPRAPQQVGNARIPVPRALLESLDLAPADLAATIASGSEMQPTISDGDALLIDLRPQPLESGAVYALQPAEGQVIIRRITQALVGGWRVSADNIPTLTETVTDAELSAIVQGRVIWRSGKI